MGLPQTAVSDHRPQTWRLLQSGHADAFTNMAVDEAILLACVQGLVPPTLRLYGWRPPGVSLGYFQELDGQVDAAECARRGFGLVRRPTGGRAILHDDEVTYSVCVGESDIRGGHGVMSSYREISRGIEAALQHLGVDAALGDRAGVSPLKAEAAKALPAACFASSARADLVQAGRKIVGSAQTRRHGAILQHGSIPLGLDIEAQLAAMPGRGGGRGDPGQHLSRAVITVSDAVGRRVDYDELCGALAQGFVRALGIRLQPGELTEQERHLAERLRTEKYATEAWNANRGRPPPRAS